MRGFYPQTGTLEDWNAAYYRLEDYFRAHQVLNKLHQSQIILRILQQAAVQHAADPSQTPTKLALEAAYAWIDEWFRRLLPDESPARASSVGRVALYLAEATTRWPTLFLADEMPVEFKTSLSDTMVQSGPDLRLSSMVPRPLDVTDNTEKVEEIRERVGRVSAVLVGAILGVVGTAVFFYFK